ncbi:Tc toxin subunit A-related protein [Cellulomonas sp. P5_C6]
MAALHTDLAYSFRRNKAVVGVRTGATAVLGQIEDLLVAAATAHRQRRYTDAVDGYTAARRLIWSQLAPLVTYEEQVVLAVDLVPSLASYAAEFLNLLPVEQPTAGVRPRVVPEVDDGPVLGLHSAKVGRDASLAAADLEVARQLESVGNPKSATFFRERAAGLDADFVKQLGEKDAPAPAVDVPGLRRVRAVGAEAAPTVALRLERTDLQVKDVISATPVVDIPDELTAARRFYAVEVGDDVKTLKWAEGKALDGADILATVYEGRRAIDVLHDVLIQPAGPADVAIGLAHAWYYETTLGLAEAHHAMGEFEQAQSWYLAAAGYRYLNPTTEAPYVWARLATCYLDQGNVLFRADDPVRALDVYQQVLGSDGTAPATSLYTVAGLAPAATQARAVIAHLDAPDDIDAAAVSPAIAAVVLDVWAQLAKIAGGLDFWGHWAANVPLWTFDYLQQVAGTFSQLAIGAERDAISFWEKADSGTLTRTQLTANVQLAAAEKQAADRQVDAARAELAAYQAAEAAANLRAADARANAAEYASKSASWVVHQALSTQLSGGQDGKASQLNQLADQMMSGSYSISGDRGTLAAAESLTAARQQRQYEIDSMNRQANELDAARVQAAQERAAGQARVAAFSAGAAAAGVRVAGAQQLLLAFDQQRFTPDVWNAMGETMNNLSQRYLVMALDIAKRMQRAYNFENDVQLSIIRPDYQAQTVHGLLAADSLLADVQSFTYQLITSTAPNPQPVRQTISLSSRYPYLFETQLRRTGHMQFQTALADFDSAYPGTYAGRIVAVEVEVDGIVPARGLSGTLTNSGISHYRVPSVLWPVGGNGVKHRVQNRESLVLSDYDRRLDALIVSPDPRRRAVFEGAGVASSWELDIPPAANDLDFAAILDVRLTFTYQARFDLDLRERVVAELEAAPAVHERQRPFPLRWLFADAFFSFYETGTLAVELGRGDFAATEDAPTLLSLGLTVASTPHAVAGGLVLRVAPPGRQPVTVTCDADGVVDSDAFQAALTAAGQGAAIGSSALGPWSVQVTAADNPALVVDGELDLDAVDNIALVLGYSFTPRA